VKSKAPDLKSSGASISTEIRLFANSFYLGGGAKISFFLGARIFVPEDPGSQITQTNT
jgi:hypothetical protein